MSDLQYPTDRDFDDGGFWYTSGAEAKKPNVIKRIEDLAKDVDDFFTPKEFPNLSRSERDALRHYYGQGLAQRRFWTPITYLAGLYNEARGIKKGHRPQSILSDLINNMSALSPDITGKQGKHLDFFEELLYENPTYTQPEMQDFIKHGLSWTINPPHEYYGK